MVNASTLQTARQISIPVPDVKETYAGLDDLGNNRLIALGSFMWPFLADSQILIAAVTSTSTVFLLYDSVLDQQCNNTFPAPLKVWLYLIRLPLFGRVCV